MQREGLQGNWAVVCAYRLAPKAVDGRLARGEQRKLASTFFKTKDQIKRIIYLVRSADQHGITLDLADGRNLNPGRPSQLTKTIETAMKAINKSDLKKKSVLLAVG